MFAIFAWVLLLMQQHLVAATLLRHQEARDAPKQTLKPQKPNWNPVNASVAEVVDGMDNGVELHRTITKTEVKLKSADAEVRRLRQKVQSVREANDVVVQKLTNIMTIRINANERKLAEKHEYATKEKAEFGAENQIHTESMKTMDRLREEKEAAEKDLVEKQTAAKEALRQQDLTQRRIHNLDSKLGTEKLKFHSLEATYGKATGELDKANKDEENMEATLNATRFSLKSEKQKLDDDLSRQEGAFSRKIKKAETERQQTQQSLFHTEQDFKTWQADQEQKAQKVSDLKKQFYKADSAYKERNQDLKHKAVKAAIEKVGGGGKGDWAWKI